MGGKSFENQMWTSLEESVGEAGVVLLRRQSFSARAGRGFQADQVTGDLLVDSPDPEWYIGVECKTINSKYRFYFNGNYKPSQFEAQMEYAEISGRDVFVAIEARGDSDSRQGWTEDRAFLFPIELFAYFNALGESKVTYEDMETFGYLLGKDGDYKMSKDALDHARANADRFATKIQNIDDE